MKHFYILSLSFLLGSSTVFAQDCNVAVATLDEGFESYEAGGNLTGCWSAIKTGSMITGVRNTAGNAHTGEKYAFGYTFNEVNVPLYLITPKLNTIDGNHSANFYLGAVGAEGATTTYQVGTLSDPTDTTTFSAFGTPVNLTMGVGQTGQPNYTNINVDIPSTTNEYIAIKIIGSAAHTAIYLDDFKWDASLSKQPFSVATFVMYPNPTTSKLVNLELQSATNTVTITSVTGQVVYKNTLNQSSAQLNLQHLNAGVYLVNVTSELISTTKKLVLN